MHTQTIIPSDALLARALHFEDLAARSGVADSDQLETARLLRAVAAEPHRFLLDPVVKRIHDRLRAIHRPVLLALLHGRGDLVPYSTLFEAGWGTFLPSKPHQAVRQAVCSMKPLAPKEWQFICLPRLGYRLVRDA